MSLVLPGWVAAQEINREMEEQADAHMAEATYWTGELRRIDSSLDIVWVGENSSDAELTPARWHIRKRIPGSVDAYIPLQGPDGSYRPPGAWMLDWLNANDMWNPRVHRSKQEARERLREAKARARKLAAEQRQDHMAEAIRAAKRVRGDGGMTKSTAAKRAGEGV